jgi:hypothetical protein
MHPKKSHILQILGIVSILHIFYINGSDIRIIEFCLKEEKPKRRKRAFICGI